MLNMIRVLLLYVAMILLCASSTVLLAVSLTGPWSEGEFVFSLACIGAFAGAGIVSIVLALE